MSSPLDGRIRAIAREEAAAARDGEPSSTSADRIAALEAAATSLHGTILRLEARLDALEKAAAQTVDGERTAVRRTRKTTGE